MLLLNNTLMMNESCALLNVSENATAGPLRPPTRLRVSVPEALITGLLMSVVIIGTFLGKNPVFSFYFPVFFPKNQCFLLLSPSKFRFLIFCSFVILCKVVEVSLEFGRKDRNLFSAIFKTTGPNKRFGSVLVPVRFAFDSVTKITLAELTCNNLFVEPSGESDINRNAILLRSAFL